MAEIDQMALDLGKALGRTDEYQAMDRAVKSADDDRDMVTLKNELQRLETSLQTAVRSGQTPPEDEMKEYEGALEKLQTLASYQRLVAAQANFEKLMTKVNAAIQQGMQEGANSRIILPS